MKLFAYIRYFSFLSFNWNIKIAFHLLREELKGERKYGIHTTGADGLQSLKKKGIDISHATIYMPVSYIMLEDIFRQFPPSPRHHFVDIGCGKGRALCLAACNDFHHLTGIDFSKELCEDAIQNLSIIQQQHPGISFTVINNDAFYFQIPPDADFIFLFNPFDEIILSGVVKNIMQSIHKFPRSIRVIYANPLYKHLFLRAGFLEIYHSKKLKYLEISILSTQPLQAIQ